MIYGLETEFGFFPDDVQVENLFESRFSDRFHQNGGRIYVDPLEHPEYATPECTNPRDLLIWDKAGELVVAKLLEGSRYRLFKNNRDSKGNTWGCHENYSPVPQQLSSSQSSGTLNSFLISRTIMTGSGRLESQGYGIYQKNREMRYGVKDDRLHVVSEDSNMSEVSTVLKAGTTGLVLQLIADGFVYNEAVDLPNLFLHRKLKDPTTFRERFGVYIQTQRRFLEAAKQYRGQDPATDGVLVLWEYVLDQLEDNFMNLSRDLDWVIKLKLLTDCAEDFGWSWTDPRMKDLDIQYHDIDRQRGLFYRLQSTGETNRIVTSEEIEHAVENPPEDTRAWVRGNFARNGGSIETGNWHEINGVYIDPTISKANYMEKLFEIGEAGVKILSLLGVTGS